MSRTCFLYSATGDADNKLIQSFRCEDASECIACFQRIYLLLKNLRKHNSFAVKNHKRDD